VLGVPAGQSEVETFSGNAWQETNGRAISFAFLLMFFCLRLPSVCMRAFLRSLGVKIIW
jgi:hypothetical protein